MTFTHPTIDTVLEQFLGLHLAGKTGLARRRIEETALLLRDCLEAEAHRVLVTRDLRLLAAEREFDPVGAVGRVGHADDLVFTLAVFLEPRWLPGDAVQRAVHLRFTDALAGFILNRHLVDAYEMACIVMDVQAGINRAKAVLRAERATARAAR